MKSVVMLVRSACLGVAPLFAAIPMWMRILLGTTFVASLVAFGAVAQTATAGDSVVLSGLVLWRTLEALVGLVVAATGWMVRGIYTSQNTLTTTTIPEIKTAVATAVTKVQSLDDRHTEIREDLAAVRQSAEARALRLTEIEKAQEASLSIARQSAAQVEALAMRAGFTPPVPLDPYRIQPASNSIFATPSSKEKL